MISIETMDGELVKVISNLKSSEFGIHELFGFTSNEKASERISLRKKQGFEFSNNSWLCKFKIDVSKDNSFKFLAINNCKFNMVDSQNWQLETPVGEFRLTSTKNNQIDSLLVSDIDTGKWSIRAIELFFLLSFFIVPILYFLMSSPIEEIKKEDEQKEPLKVTIIKPQNTVNIARENPSIKVKPLTKAEIANRAVKRNLGFLGLVGSSKIKDATGGVPQKLEKATAGAGAGGDAGSGGELVTGLGKGLKKTTVGNTGVAGLGGIGTKGAGGGKGGYGNTLVASGEGTGISAISVSSNDVVLEGGLSRYAINATIAKYINQVRKCYEDQLRTIPSLEGMVTVNFEISGSGMLNYSNVKKSSLNNNIVEKCITSKMMTWKFPKPKGGTSVNVNYPFMLRPVGS